MNKELFGLYSIEMALKDSARALKSVGTCARRKEAGEYSESRSRAPMKLNQIILLLPLMAELIIHTAKFA